MQITKYFCITKALRHLTHHSRCVKTACDRATKVNGRDSSNNWWKSSAMTCRKLTALQKKKRERYMYMTDALQCNRTFLGTAFCHNCQKLRLSCFETQSQSLPQRLFGHQRLTLFLSMASGASAPASSRSTYDWMTLQPGTHSLTSRLETAHEYALALPESQHIVAIQNANSIKWCLVHSFSTLSIPKSSRRSQPTYLALRCSSLMSWLTCSSRNSTFSPLRASERCRRTIFSTSTCLSTSTNWTIGASASWAIIAQFSN